MTAAALFPRIIVLPALLDCLAAHMAVVWARLNIETEQLLPVDSTTLIGRRWVIYDLGFGLQHLLLSAGHISVAKFRKLCGIPSLRKFIHQKMKLHPHDSKIIYKKKHK